MESFINEVESKLSSLRVELSEKPSSIEFRDDISYELGFNFFIKRDDVLGKYGGNKVRKLEFLFARIREKGLKDVCVFGPTGSHHILANLIYGIDFGFRFVSFVFPTFLYKAGDAYVVQNTELVRRMSAHFFLVPNYIIAFIMARIFSLSKGAFLVPAGSTSPLSSLGFVLSAFEIYRDFASGKIPYPDVVILPAGTMGTCAGLSCGFALCGMSRTRVLGVRVVEKLICNIFFARRLCKGIFDIISSYMGYSADINRFMTFVRRNFELVDGFIGRGYGYPTSDGLKAIEFFSRFGLKLDKVYTSKTLSAVLHMKDELKGKNVIFYYTLNTKPLPQ